MIGQYSLYKFEFTYVYLKQISEKFSNGKNSSASKHIKMMHA